ncbi:MAG: type II toxin-antitoxin system RelE/ParE family toxin [Nitrospirae bacterium]|nr:type II toxin-antitoxin system RelE/ParE family toxin [Nitrospirota bacterium]
MKVEWLPGAIADLQRLRDFLVPHSNEAATRAVTVIKGAINLLMHHPYIGKPVETMPKYRDLVIPFGTSGYVLRYRIETERILVVALKHGKEAGFAGQ